MHIDELRIAIREMSRTFAPLCLGGPTESELAAYRSAAELTIQTLQVTLDSWNKPEDVNWDKSELDSPMPRNHREVMEEFNDACEAGRDVTKTKLYRMAEDLGYNATMKAIVIISEAYEAAGKTEAEEGASPDPG